MGDQRRGLVLVVEDEPAIADVVRRYLLRDGFTVRLATTGTTALDVVRAEHPVALVLDIGLGSADGVDGLEVCRRLRGEGNEVPLLFVTARDDEVDRIVGLELGADDYITKPFSPRELVARVRTVLRRTTPAAASPVLAVGPVRLDESRRRVSVDGREVALTATEFALLAHLMRRPGQVFSRDQLLAAVWGYSSVAGARTVDVHVAQVRAKLGPTSPIRTVRGVGYAADDEPAPA